MIQHRALQYLPNWSENLCSHKPLHIHVHSSVIQNHQNLGTTKLFFYRWMNKQTMVLLYNGMLVTKRNGYKAAKRCGWILNSWNLVAETHLKGLHNDSKNMIFWKSLHCRDDRKISGFQGFGWWGKVWIGEAQGFFCGGGTTLYVAIVGT